MDTGRDFRTKYLEVEAQLQARAEADGDVFLPNPVPPGPVDYVFICMEPSLGRWARTAEDADEKVQAGFRNFGSSVEDFILHFSIIEYLCEPGQRYHITDVSKGAMLVERARDERVARYDRWYSLLIEELRLVSKSGVGIFAVGNQVARFLADRDFPWPFGRIMHYSGVAAKARNEGIVGHEDRFETFKQSVSMEDLLVVAERVLRSAGIPDRFRSEAMARLQRSELSESRKKLMFNYKLAFEEN